MNPKPIVQRYLVSAACLVVVIAGMRAARSLVVPFLLAAFFAVVLAPMLHWLERKRVPTPIALLLILLGFTLVCTGPVLMVGKSFNDFSHKLPEYQVALIEHSQDLTKRLRAWGIEVPEIPDAGEELRDGSPMDERPAIDPLSNVGTDPPADPASSQAENPPAHPLELDWILNMIKGMLSGLSSLFSNALVVMITLIFMLMEASRLPAKFRAMLDKSSPAKKHTEVILGNVRRYVAIKTATSALTGVLVTVLLWLLGIDYAILWGLVAFLFNFIPNIGSIMAAVPAVGLSLLQAGLPHALGAAAGYVAINCFISYAVEPRYMGKGLGLSTLVVFLSLVFWGWVLGPVGMLLSAPLTMIIKIVLDDYDDTHWIAVLLSAKA